MITKEDIEKRLELLQKEYEKVNGVLNQAMSDLNAINGAIQDCQYWLAELNKEPKEDLAGG